MMPLTMAKEGEEAKIQRVGGKRKFVSIWRIWGLSQAPG